MDQSVNLEEQLPPLSTANTTQFVVVLGYIAVYPLPMRNMQQFADKRR
jgi:hypothetical protein